MPTLDLGQVKGDTGTSLRNRETWTANTAYVNNSQYIDIVTNDGNLYMCKTSHTSETTFSDENWTMVVQKGDKGDKGDIGVTPTIQAGTATILDANASPTVSATTSGDGTTTFNFGIPKGDTSEIETPTFDDTVSTYTTLNAANTAAETASNAIKSKVSIFTTLSNMKKSFSAIVQGLKILGTNVGAITGITSDLAGESETVAASIKAVNQLNSNLGDWEDISSGVTKAQSNSNITLLVNKKTKTAIASGYIYAPSNTSSWTNAFSLPAKAKPKTNTSFFSGNGNGILNTNGQLNYIFGNNTGYGYFNFTYPVA